MTLHGALVGAAWVTVAGWAGVIALCLWSEAQWQVRQLRR